MITRYKKKNSSCNSEVQQCTTPLSSVTKKDCKKKSIAKIDTPMSVRTHNGESNLEDIQSPVFNIHVHVPPITNASNESCQIQPIIHLHFGDLVSRLSSGTKSEDIATTDETLKVVLADGNCDFEKQSELNENVLQPLERNEVCKKLNFRFRENHKNLRTEKPQAVLQSVKKIKENEKSPRRSNCKGQLPVRRSIRQANNKKLLKAVKELTVSHIVTTKTKRTKSCKNIKIKNDSAFLKNKFGLKDPVVILHDISKIIEKESNYMLGVKTQDCFNLDSRSPFEVNSVVKVEQHIEHKKHSYGSLSECDTEHNPVDHEKNKNVTDNKESEQNSTDNDENEYNPIDKEKNGNSTVNEESEQNSMDDEESEQNSTDKNKSEQNPTDKDKSEQNPEDSNKNDSSTDSEDSEQNSTDNEENEQNSTDKEENEQSSRNSDKSEQNPTDSNKNDSSTDNEEREQSSIEDSEIEQNSVDIEKNSNSIDEVKSEQTSVDSEENAQNSTDSDECEGNSADDEENEQNKKKKDNLQSLLSVSKKNGEIYSIVYSSDNESRSADINVTVSKVLQINSSSIFEFRNNFHKTLFDVKDSSIKDEENSQINNTILCESEKCKITSLKKNESFSIFSEDKDKFFNPKYVDIKDDRTLSLNSKSKESNHSFGGESSTHESDSDSDLPLTIDFDKDDHQTALLMEGDMEIFNKCLGSKNNNLLEKATEENKLSTEQNDYKYTNVNSPSFQLELIKKEMKERDVSKDGPSKKKSKEKTTSQSDIEVPENSVAKKMKLSNGTIKKKQRAKSTEKLSSEKEYIPLQVSGSTKFTVAQLNKIKPYKAHKAKNFKNEWLFGKRVNRHLDPKFLQIYQFKKEAAKKRSK